PTANIFLFVEFDSHLESAAEPIPSHRRGPSHYSPAAHIGDTLNLLLDRGRSPEVIKLKDFLQRLASAFANRQIVERKMGQQPPIRATLKRGACGRRGLLQALDMRYRCRTFDLKIAVWSALSPKRSLPGKSRFVQVV